ncbi:hypothetical protein BN440_1816 [Erwinia amylovora MR1]|nr:hypothetical protein BN440_1816 [Erwinia amylovora MR1]
MNKNNLQLNYVLLMLAQTCLRNCNNAVDSAKITAGKKSHQLVKIIEFFIKNPMLTGRAQVK